MAYRAGLLRATDAQILLMPAPPEGLAPDIGRLALRDPVSALKFALTSVSTLPERTGWFAPPRGLFTAEVSPAVLRAAQEHRADESLTALRRLSRRARVIANTVSILARAAAGSVAVAVPIAASRLVNSSIDTNNPTAKASRIGGPARPISASSAADGAVPARVTMFRGQLLADKQLDAVVPGR